MACGPTAVEPRGVRRAAGRTHGRAATSACYSRPIENNPKKFFTRIVLPYYLICAWFSYSFWRDGLDDRDAMFGFFMFAVALPFFGVCVLLYRWLKD